MPTGRPYTFEAGRVYAIGAQVPWFVPKRLITRWAGKNGFGDIETWTPADPRLPVRIEKPTRPYNTVFIFRRIGPTSSFGLPEPEIVWVLPRPIEAPKPKFEVKRSKEKG